jgi:hypothetical protein
MAFDEKSFDEMAFDEKYFDEVAFGFDELVCDQVVDSIKMAFDEVVGCLFISSKCNLDLLQRLKGR